MDRRLMEVFRAVYGRLEGTGIRWVLTGSLAFALQGLPFQVRDIDLQTDREGAYRMEKLFSDGAVRNIRFSSRERIRSYFGEFRWKGVRVEVMGDLQKRVGGEWEAPVDLLRHRRWVVWERCKVPVLSLEYEYQAYRKMGRLEKAERIRKEAGLT
ncbi:hypothetical protein C8P63_1514 [Melghirimyces profundicolus]|uniref:Uncharacterized protein n=1 Tax=Melghirimyces profundicolus TaxID=1242148 RepID=A0A2T6AUM5_9BACL|nr:hypothetical protein [Melghirimyces profundicolus]PTX47507.1 hypothetical protein C8P63_1514 [Melghirimyces profundicolus]